MDMIQPKQIEKARKIVKQVNFKGFPIISLDYTINQTGLQLIKVY